jgi:hypothetical protein
MAVQALPPTRSATKLRTLSQRPKAQRSKQVGENLNRRSALLSGAFLLIR